MPSLDATDPDYPAYTLAEAAEYWRVSIVTAKIIRKKHNLGRKRYEANVYHAGPVWKLSYNEIMSQPCRPPGPMRQGPLMREDAAFRAYAEEIDALYPQEV